jgi:hypothetical protein
VVESRSLIWHALGIGVMYKPRMLVPGKEGATLPFMPALSAPADDASFLRGVVEAMPAFVLRLDHEQRIRYVNRVDDRLALCQLIGRPEQAISDAQRTGRVCSYLGKGADTFQSGTPTRDEGYVVPVDRRDSDGRRDVCIAPERSSNKASTSFDSRSRPGTPGHRFSYAYGTAMLSTETN